MWTYYLSVDELAVFGVDPGLLQHCRDTGTVDPRVRRALGQVAAVTRAHPWVSGRRV